MDDIQKYYFDIDNIARGLTRTRPSCRQDIKQELIIAVLEHIDEGHEREYLLAIARYKAIDALRSRRYNFSYGDKFQHVYLDGFSDELLEDSIGDVSAFRVPSFEEVVVEKHDIHEALEKLDDKDQLLIVLRFWYDFTEEALGRIFGITRSGVSHRCTRILGVLRKSLA